MMHLNRNLWIALLAWAGFFPVAWLVGREPIITSTSVLSISVACGVLAAYGIGAIRIVRMPSRTLNGGHYLVLGVVTVCWFYVMRAAWGIAWRAAGRPDAWETSLFLPWTIWGITTGYMVHLGTAGAVSGVIPRRNWIRVGIAVALGVLASFLAVLLWGDASLVQ